MRSKSKAWGQVILAWVLCLTGFTVKVEAQARAEQARLPLVRYYIVAKARLQYPKLVWIFGASNLPPGSVISAHVYDFLGIGNRRLSQDAAVAVGKNGLFEMELHPINGLEFRNNTICTLVFQPTAPGQPSSVLKVVGKRGENLGMTGDNPLVSDNSRNKLLYVVTAVME
jgi:hypothetical protein